MFDVKPLVKWACLGLAAFGIIMVAVSIWAMVEEHGGLKELAKLSAINGESPKLAISAGVFLIAIAVTSFFVSFDNKTHAIVVGASLLLPVALTIAAMSIAIDDINKINTLTQFIGGLFKDINANDFQFRDIENMSEGTNSHNQHDANEEKYIKSTLMGIAIVSGISFGYEIMAAILIAINVLVTIGSVNI